MSSIAAPQNFLVQSRWNPYLVGAAIGVLSWLVFALVDKPLGVTTSLTGLAGACATPFLGADTIGANAFSFPWISTRILPVGALGKVRLPDVTGVPALVWFVALIAIALTVFVLIERAERVSKSAVS